MYLTLVSNVKVMDFVIVCFLLTFLLLFNFISSVIFVTVYVKKLSSQPFFQTKNHCQYYA